jgi:5-methylcytosine-specific restriction enzyme A
MPRRLKTRCGVRGCPRTTYERYCDEHKALAQRVYDERRGKPSQRGYDAAWQPVAKMRRYLDAGLCQRCKATGRLTRSVLVDHIIPIYVRPDWRLEIDNTQVLCTLCHGAKCGDDLRKYGGRMQRSLSASQRAERACAQQLEQPPRHDVGYCPLTEGGQFFGQGRIENPPVPRRALFREIG